MNRTPRLLRRAAAAMSPILLVGLLLGSLAIPLLPAGARADAAPAPANPADPATLAPAKLAAEVARLRAAVAAKSVELAARQERLARLEARAEAQRAALAEADPDLALVESVARGAARDALHLAQTSLPARLAGPDGPDGLEDAARALLDDPDLPSAARLTALTDGLLADLALSGRVAGLHAPILGPDGDAVTAQVLRLGGNVALYRLGADLGPLVIRPDGRLSAGGAALPGPVARAAAAWLDRLPDDPAGLRPAAADAAALPLPLDLSDGAALRAESRAAGLWAHIRSGGPLVWPILGVGLLGLCIGLERCWVLGRVRRPAQDLPDRLAEALRAGRPEDGRALCAGPGDSPACRVLAAGLDHAGAAKEVLENVFQDAILKEAPRLERLLPTLSLLGAVAPLLGLLGTVTGMINTFTVMTQAGSSDPKLMSGGISEALVTTELGLAVAIPLLLLHHLLDRRVDGILADMEEKGTALGVTLLEPGGRP